MFNSAKYIDGIKIIIKSPHLQLSQNKVAFIMMVMLMKAIFFDLFSILRRIVVFYEKKVIKIKTIT